MVMSACCDAARDRKMPAWVRSVREVLAWVLPSATLLLVPKCPVCLAAHVSLWTGLGLSLSTATWLRLALLLVCIASLLFLMVKRLERIRAPLRTNYQDMDARFVKKTAVKSKSVGTWVCTFH